MDIISSSTCNNIDLDSLEIYNKPIEALFNLNPCDGLIKDILSTSIEPKILKDYVFRAPIIEDCNLTYGYKMKLLILLTCNFEFTEKSTLGETKFLRKEKLLNVAFNLPRGYKVGQNINVIPKIVDISYKIINEKTLYLSSYISFISTI